MHLLFKHLALGCFFLFSIFAPNLSAQETDLVEEASKCVVHISATLNIYNFESPWQPPFQAGGTGSGCIIEGNKILTNAHVVAGAAALYVKKNEDVTPYPARIIHIENEYDLALIAVDDPAFFEGIKGVEIGDMPYRREEIYALGYPRGGEKLSVTKGVVSRTEMGTAAHSGIKTIFTQIDAAINPGSSGGPVIKDGKLVGVATQGIAYGQNLGYMVPQVTIQRFLESFKKKENASLPSLDIEVQEFLNPDLRNYLKVETKRGGVLINKVLSNSVAKDLVKENDVLLAADDIPIASDATYEFRPGERISALFLVHRKKINEKLKLTLLRDGDDIEVEVTLSNGLNDAKLVPHRSHGQAPSYFIKGGMVFQALDENYLSIWGEDWFSLAPKPLVSYLLQGEKSKERSEVVVMSKVLAHRSTIGYSFNSRDAVVKSLNGVKIKSLRHLKETFSSIKDPFIILLFEDNSRLVLKKETLDKYHREILETYGVYKDASLDLI